MAAVSSWPDWLQFIDFNLLSAVRIHNNLTFGQHSLERSSLQQGMLYSYYEKSLYLNQWCPHQIQQILNDLRKKRPCHYD